MAFCNSCGTNVEPAAKFCPKCGAAMPVTAAAPAAPPPAAPPAAKSTSGLKIVLIVVAVIVALGILGTAAVGFFAWRVARSSHVETKDGNVRVNTPFGTVESTDNPDAAARNLGVALYPGARVMQGNAADVTFGGVHSTSAQFETDDAPDKVAEFYKAEFPNANVAVADGKQFTIVSAGDKSVITVNIQPEDGKTVIHIANVSSKGSGESN